MRYTGVLFDLFGTLVGPFRMREHTEVVRECAELLEIGFEECHRCMGETYHRRIRGEFSSVADNLDWIACQMGRRVSRRALVRAEAVYDQFTSESLQPMAGARELLEHLTSRGVRIGLVSNCAPDLPRLWRQSALARYFGYCAFSCELHAVKPEPAIYCAALDALGLLPNQTLYVGDGSDEELSGAARCGMQPVLVGIDVTDSYDARRPDVTAWTGPVIRSLSELSCLLEGTGRVPLIPGE